MANAPVHCPVCDGVRTRVRDTQPVDQAEAEERFVKALKAARRELGREGDCSWRIRVQLVECYACPPTESGQPRVYRLTYLPPTYVETRERYLRPESEARRKR